MAERRLGVVEFGKEITDKVTFGKELQRHINAGFSVERIGQWVSLVHYDWLRCSDKDLPFFKLLCSLGLMSSDLCMEWSYEELEEVIHDLLGYEKKIGDKVTFGIELKRRIEVKRSMSVIGNWADLVYERLENSEDEIFKGVLQKLRLISVGPKVRYSYEELDQIADDLIAGKEVNL